MKKWLIISLIVFLVVFGAIIFSKYEKENYNHEIIKTGERNEQIEQKSEYGIEQYQETLRTKGVDCENPNPLMITSLAIDPKNTNNLYTAIRLKGIFKSEDGGINWKAVNNGIYAYPIKDRPDERCYDWAGFIDIDPTNPKRVVFAATDINVGTINDPYSETSGIWETLNGGESWHQIVNENMNAGGMGAFAMDMKNPQTLYFGTGYGHVTYIEGDPNKFFNTIGILHKTTDGGKTWEELPTGLVPEENMKGDIYSEASKVYVDYINPKNILFLTSTHNMVTRDKEQIEVQTKEQFGPMISRDGGYTWTRLNKKLPTDYQAFWEGAIAKHNFNHIYLLPVHSVEGVPSNKQKSFISTDGGNSFHETKLVLNVARYDPYDTTGKRMLAYSFLSRQLLESKDAGITWSGKYDLPEKAKTSQVLITDIVWDPLDSNILYLTGTSANMWKSLDGGKTWQNILNPDKI